MGELAKAIRAGKYTANLGKPKSILLVGHSFGSYISQALIASQSDIVEGTLQPPSPPFPRISGNVLTNSRRSRPDRHRLPQRHGPHAPVLQMDPRSLSLTHRQPAIRPMARPRHRLPQLWRHLRARQHIL
jgi:pimeloyl-ACP methyl ester carboxylesterase